MTKNVKLIGIPENDFLCIFIIASSPGVHTFFCLWRVNKKLPQGETSQIAFQRSRSISQKWKIYMLKWAYPPLREYCYLRIILVSSHYWIWSLQFVAGFMLLMPRYALTFKKGPPPPCWILKSVSNWTAYIVKGANLWSPAQLEKKGQPCPWVKGRARVKSQPLYQMSS